MKDAEAAKCLPMEGYPVDAFYTRRMLKYLGPRDADRFSLEAFRVLQRGGICTAIVPDIKPIFHNIANREMLMRSSRRHLSVRPRPRSVTQWLRLNDRWGTKSPVDVRRSIHLPLAAEARVR